MAMKEMSVFQVTPDGEEYEVVDAQARQDIRDLKENGTVNEEEIQVIVSAHNTDETAHNDIRLQFQNIVNQINAFLNVDDATRDELSEVLALIDDNKDLIDAITINKVNVADIIDNLTTNVANKPLSAAQGVVIKGLIDALQTAVNGKAAKATTLAGYGITDGATKEEVNNLSKEIVNLKNEAKDLSLGMGEDGRIYLLNGGVAQGNGIELPEGASGDVIGNIGENNVIVLNGDLADGTYTLKYEMENGSVINIGNMVLDSNVYHSITNNLTNCTNGNSATRIVEGNSYNATITPKSGYELKSLTVTMGGNAVSVTNGVINIASVTGDIVITAVAEEIVVNYTNLADPTSADWWADSYFSSGGQQRSNADYEVTNYIGLVHNGDVIRVKGLDMTGTIAEYRCAVYTSAKALHPSHGVGTLTAFTADSIVNKPFTNLTLTSTGAEFTVTNADSEGVYWRFGGKLVGTAEDVIITINEEI